MNVCGWGARTFLMPCAVCRAWGGHKRKHAACCLPPRLSLHSRCWRTHSPSRSEAPAGHPTPELISDTAFLELACRSEGSVFRAESSAGSAHRTQEHVLLTRLGTIQEQAGGRDAQGRGWGKAASTYSPAWECSKSICRGFGTQASVHKQGSLNHWL